jgi:hypothetical protein
MAAEATASRPGIRANLVAARSRRTNERFRAWTVVLNLDDLRTLAVLPREALRKSLGVTIVNLKTATRIHDQLGNSRTDPKLSGDCIEADALIQQ